MKARGALRWTWRGGALLVLTMVSACGQPARPRGYGEQTFVKTPLGHHVGMVHVRTESGWQAGIPLNGWSVAAPMDMYEAYQGIVADSIPLAPMNMWGVGEGRPATASAQGVVTEERMICLFMGCYDRYAPNPVVFNAQPALNTAYQLYVAGFKLNAANRALPEFWSTPAVMVEVDVVAREDLKEPNLGTSAFFLLAPHGDYSGFVGGPVIVDTKKGASIVGIVEAQRADYFDTKAVQAVLQARAIPLQLSEGPECPK